MYLQIILDRHATVAYMVKYASNGEQSGRSLQNIFRSVMQKVQDSDNPVSKLRSQNVCCVDRRDVRGGEASIILFGGKHCHSSFNL